jgi:hypothetical protein
MGTARRCSPEPEPRSGYDRRTTACGFAKLGSARRLAFQASWQLGRAGRGPPSGAHLGFAASRAGGGLAGVWSHMGIAAAACCVRAPTELEPPGARALIGAAARPACARSRTLVGRSRRAGTRLG